MKYLYHGSSQSGLSQLNPHKSIHGTYVYATPDKTLATIFSGKNGSDFIYALFRNSKQDSWQLVERIPGVFKINFQTKSSIYTLDASSFKDIATGFVEFVSESPVEVIEEEIVEDVYQKLLELHHQNLVHIYFYPDRPKEIPEDDHDLIDHCLLWAKLNHKDLDIHVFERLLFLHPKLLEKVNEQARAIQPEFIAIEQKDLISIFDKFLILQLIEPTREQFLSFALQQYISTYPELSAQFEEKIKVLDRSKEEQISFIIETFSNIFPMISPAHILRAKNRYLEDSREISEIGMELYSIYQVLSSYKENRDSSIPTEIAENSILLIGPMGTGKSTIARELKQKCNLPNFSLDHRDQWHTLYLMKDLFPDDDDFYIFLTNYVFHQLREPTIVDFGAGHSVYSDSEKAEKLRQLIAPFRNIVLLLPSEDPNESFQILNERNGLLPTDEKAKRNWDLLTASTNQEICTMICYTKDKTPTEVTEEIITRMNARKEKILVQSKREIN